ncbi:MAG: hypothetical protein LBJ32_03125 [Oscillospiraceae bacterium]|jgi:hypothetical protein|nr:hypothetical protein [Oscillospiraceae bacterium]
MTNTEDFNINKNKVKKVSFKIFSVFLAFQILVSYSFIPVAAAQQNSNKASNKKDKASIARDMKKNLINTSIGFIVGFSVNSLFGYKKENKKELEILKIKKKPMQIEEYALKLEEFFAENQSPEKIQEIKVFLVERVSDKCIARIEKLKEYLEQIRKENFFLKETNDLLTENLKNNPSKNNPLDESISKKIYLLQKENKLLQDQILEKEQNFNNEILKINQRTNFEEKMINLPNERHEQDTKIIQNLNSQIENSQKQIQELIEKNKLLTQKSLEQQTKSNNLIENLVQEKDLELYNKNKQIEALTQQVKNLNFQNKNSTEISQDDLLEELCSQQLSLFKENEQLQNQIIKKNQINFELQEKNIGLSNENQSLNDKINKFKKNSSNNRKIFKKFEKGFTEIDIECTKQLTENAIIPKFNCIEELIAQFTIISKDYKIKFLDEKEKIKEYTFGQILKAFQRIIGVVRINEILFEKICRSFKYITDKTLVKSSFFNNLNLPKEFKIYISNNDDNDIHTVPRLISSLFEDPTVTLKVNEEIIEKFKSIIKSKNFSLRKLEEKILLFQQLKASLFFKFIKQS